MVVAGTKRREKEEGDSVDRRVTKRSSRSANISISETAATALRLKCLLGCVSQGCLFLATLGWRPESGWDSGFAAGI